MEPITVAALIGSAASAMTSIYNQHKSVQQQKELYDYQNQNYLKYARAMGATPASITSGFTKSGTGSMPSVNTASVPDFGSNLISAYQTKADADLKESEKNKNLLEMEWFPRRWMQDINESESLVFNRQSQNELFKSQTEHFKELVKDVRLKRPWEIGSLKQGLINARAEYSKILSQTDYFKASAKYAESGADLNYSHKFNVDQDGFRMMWENQLRANGWNPSASPWSNISQNLFTKPKEVKNFLDNSIEFLNYLDNRLKQGLGQHYKRNVMLLYGGAKLYDAHQRYSLMRSQKIKNAFGTVIPIAGAAAGMPIAPLSPSAGQYWWEKD